MIADLCGLRQNVVSIHKIGDGGNFGATVMAGITGQSGRAQQKIETICARLRLKYRVCS